MTSLRPYLPNILRAIAREARWIAADRGPAAACELLRAVIVHANELLSEYLNERCFVCGLALDDDNSYGSDEFPLCREHHGAVEMLVAFMTAGGSAEELRREYEKMIEAEKEQINAN